MQLKFQFYEKYGVEEYYLYDPESGSLEGWLREGGRLVAIDDMSGHVSPRLGIRFEPGEGPDSLRIFGPDGQPFFTHQQMAEHAEAEHHAPRPNASAPIAWRPGSASWVWTPSDFPQAPTSLP